MGTLGTYTPPKPLVIDDFDLQTEAVTLVSGAGALVKGTVLGRITTGGKFKTVNTANSDGSEAPYAVLAEDADATSADTLATVYLTGSFNQAALTFGGTDTYATHKVAMRKLCLFVKPVIA